MTFWGITLDNTDVVANFSFLGTCMSPHFIYEDLYVLMNQMRNFSKLTQEMAY